jgi:hypothetical protein
MRDRKTMKTIAVMTLVFLPGTLVAVSPGRANSPDVRQLTGK